MPSSDIERLHAAIENGDCDASLVAALEGCVREQAAEGWYDYAVNKYLLKLYTCSPETLKYQIVATILVLGMMQLPGKDILSFQLLIPLSYEESPDVKAVVEGIRSLECGQFQKFWSDRQESSATGIFSVTGFDDAVRNFIFGNICHTFTNLKVNNFKQMLNLENAKDYESFCNRNRSAIVSVRI